MRASKFDTVVARIVRDNHHLVVSHYSSRRPGRKVAPQCYPPGPARRTMTFGQGGAFGATRSVAVLCARFPAFGPLLCGDADGVTKYFRKGGDVCKTGLLTFVGARSPRCC